MQIDFEELQAVCDHCETGDCDILVENNMLNQTDDPDYPEQNNECREEVCPLKLEGKPNS